MSVAGSTLARRALGRELRRLRLEKGMYQAEAARLAETSAQSISRFEEGRSTRITSLQVNALCDAYGATDDERRILLGLVQEIRAARDRDGGWWRAYADQITDDFDHYLALEDAASRLSAWIAAIVPGLLQTPAYRRAIAWTESPGLPTEQIEKRVEWLRKRQRRLEDPELFVEVLVSEAVLHVEMGGPAVMAEQLHYLADAGRLPNISIRVVPFDARSHLGALVGSFFLMEFPPLPQSKLVEPPIVYVEEYAGDLYLEREIEVRRYRTALEEIRRVALDESQSRRKILALAKEYEA